MIELVSRKYYRDKIDDDNQFDEEKLVFNEEKNHEMIKYIIDHKEMKNSKEQKIINLIIDE